MASSFHFFDTESKILHLIRQGDEQALVMLFEEARPMAVSYVKRNSGTEADAEEVLQEAVVILWERLRSGTFETRAKLTTFVMGVVKNLWLHRLSRRKRETPLTEGFDPPGEEQSPLDMVIEGEQLEAVKDAMARITEICRKVLLMFYWEEKSMEEIAGALGFANAETAKSKKYQCRKNFEEHLRSLLS